MVYITGYHSLFNFHLHFEFNHSCTYTRIGYFWDPGCKGTAGATVLKWTITPSKTAPKLRMGGPCAICSLTRISQACRLALTFPIKRISHLLPFLSPPHACIILYLPILLTNFVPYPNLSLKASNPLILHYLTIHVHLPPSTPSSCLVLSPRHRSSLD